jgi:hypothetical protein
MLGVMYWLLAVGIRFDGRWQDEKLKAKKIPDTKTPDKLIACFCATENLPPTR